MYTRKNAFTLVELLVVVAIIGLLATIGVTAYSSAKTRAKFAAAQGFESNVLRSLGSEIVGEWLLDEGSGTAVSDTSGNGHQGTATGMTWTTGVYDHAGSFGAGRYVLLGNDSSFVPSSFTITAWIKPGDFSGSYNYIYSNARDCCGTYNGINLIMMSNNLVGAIWNSTTQNITSNTKISNDPVWTHVAFSYDGSKLSLYINGVLDKTVNSALGVGRPASFNTYIGAMGFSPATYGFNGSIDQVRFYSGAIMASAIHKNYLAEKGKYLAIK